MCIQYLVNIPINLQPKPKALTVSQSRPTQIIQTRTQQVQQPQITEEEYYRQQGVEQLQRIKAEQDRIQAKLNSAIENYNRRRTDSREKKVDFLQTQLNTLKELESKAATGKYDYDALASFAYDYANYQSNRGAQAPTQLTQKRSESNAEFEQRLIQQMKDKGEAYLQRQTTIAPTQISYSEPSKIGGPQPGQDLYANIDDITGYKGGPSIAYTKPVGGQAIVIKPTNKQTGYGRPTSPTQPKQYVYVPLEEVEKRGGFVPGKQPSPNEIKDYIKQQQIRDELETLKKKGAWEEGKVFSYYPGAGTQMLVPSISPGPLKFVEPNSFIENPTIKYIKDKTDARILELESQLQEVETPSLREVQSAMDNRGALRTIFHLGREPKITGEEAIYATENILGENIQTQLKVALDIAYEQKKKELTAKIDINKYQERVNAGEDIAKVQAELDEEYNKSNIELNKFSDNFIKQWQETTGTKIQSVSEQVYFDTQIVGRAKDTQAKVGGLFLEGTATSAAIGTGTTLLLGPASAVGLGAGLILVGGSYGIAYGKAAYTGKTTYASALNTGFNKREAVERGLVGAATDIAPFAYSMTGVLAGGMIAGTIISAARKPITNRYSVELSKPSIRAGDKLFRQAEITVNGKKYPGVIYPEQKIAENVISGSRAETTTAWRDFANRNFGGNLKPIDTGYPSDTAGRASAIKLYKQYGVSDYMAKEITKFIKPQIVETRIIGGQAYQTDKGLVSGKLFLREKNIKKVVDGIETGDAPDRFSKIAFVRNKIIEDKYGATHFLEVQATSSSQKGAFPTFEIGVRKGISKSVNWASDSPIIQRTKSFSLYDTANSKYIDLEYNVGLLIKDIKPSAIQVKGSSTPRPAKPTLDYDPITFRNIDTKTIFRNIDTYRERFV